MGNTAHKVDVLFELGKVSNNRGIWLDYLQYGFGEEDIQNLIELVSDVSLHDAPSYSDDVWVPLHAWRALGQLGNTLAVEPLIGMFDTLCDDDWALEELPVVLAMLGKEAIGPLTGFMGDSSHEEYARIMAVSGLEEIASRDPSTRSEIVSIITDYLEAPDTEAIGLNGSAVSALITLQAKDSIDTLRRLYASGNVDLLACGDIEDVEMELGLRSGRDTLRPNYGELIPSSGQIGKERKKIGRNDPCPCGSGKKYKKCCLPW